jgi:vancomycin resistance protein YoaR
MQASLPQPSIETGSLSRKIGFFLIPPLTGLIIASLILAFIVASYQSRHSEKIYTGVTIAGIDLSAMSQGDASTALAARLNNENSGQIKFTLPVTGQSWEKTPAELGLDVDLAATVELAFAVGRSGTPFTQIQEMFATWYYGRSLFPVLVLDEDKLNGALNELASNINLEAANAQLAVNGETAVYTPSQVGLVLDQADLRSRMLPALMAFQSAEIELLVHEIAPTINDPVDVSTSILHTYSNPVTFYLQAPLDENDLTAVTLSPDQLSSWLRADVSETAAGQLQHNVFVDENALRQWLSQYIAALYREPVNARFYFDDNTEELVLVAPHVNGRELDIDATIAAFQIQVNTPNRSVPFVVKDIVPLVNKDATAVELGITGLVTETTTWFYGSTDERKHNIARAAANFYGIVIAPGEEFSFNKYLGSISEADGYTQGFIIINGQTVKGIGGGVCQVSTTLYQTAFNSGFPITERLPHGYMLGYYNDGEGPGMDATIFSPLVDMKFINNTEYHLLIENYYNEELEALTFKFYSTNLSRRIEKEVLPWENVTDIPGSDQDRWEYNEDLEPGTVIQIDWATEGADVYVQRTVYNADGVLIGDQIFASNYIPVPNVFQYGPGVEPYDYSLVPDEN